MLQVNVEDRQYTVNVFHHEVLIHSIRTSHRLDGRELANILNSVYELGKKDGADELDEVFNYFPVVETEPIGTMTLQAEVAHVEPVAYNESSNYEANGLVASEPFAKIVG